MEYAKSVNAEAGVPPPSLDDLPAAMFGVALWIGEKLQQIPRASGVNRQISLFGEDQRRVTFRPACKGVQQCPTRLVFLATTQAGLCWQLRDGPASDRRDAPPSQRTR